MRRPGFLMTACLVAALSLGAMPAMAQANLGFFEGPPDSSNTATGAVRLTGWALADAGIRRVLILVDGENAGQALHGRPRGAITNSYPGYPDSAAPGFGFILNSTDYLNGNHVVSARVERNDGTFHDVSPARTLQFQNNTHNLRPFGRVDRPDRSATLFGTCDIENPFRRPTIVEGWALDLGVEIGDTGIGYVELLLDGVPISRSTTDCVFNPALGGFTNCYGTKRLDIENQYPFAFNSPNSGFRFAMDIGALIYGGRVEGAHTLTIRAGDLSNQIENIDEMSVTFVCSENIGNEPSFGLIESPRLNREYNGLMRVEGWALDIDGIRRVEIFVDGNFVRGAALDPLLTRQSVSSSYPGFPDTDHPVFRAFIDTNDFVDNVVHQLEVIAVDELFARTLIGETDFLSINNFE